MKRAIAAALLPLPWLLHPATAKADPALSPADWQFLNVITNIYRLPIPSPDYAISHAHATCDYIATHPRGQEYPYVESTTIWTDGTSASLFINAAAVNYCPQFAEHD